MTDAPGTRAELHRMVMDDHVCPYGLKALSLLRRHGYAVDDHHLTSRAQTDDFKEQHDVKTTPQVFIDGERIGGYDALREHLGKHVRSPGDTSYRPIIAIFSVGLLLALSVSYVAFDTPLTVRAFEWFIAITMCLLGLQKLKDIESFSTMFLNYDLLARRVVPYATIYPFAETLAGLLMVAGVLIGFAAPVALFIGTVGAVSVFKAVYIDRRELKCACAGGDSDVPLGAVSLTENLMMIAMAVWMPVRMAVFG